MKKHQNLSENLLKQDFLYDKQGLQFLVQKRRMTAQILNYDKKR